MSTLTATEARTCRILYYGPRGSGKRENLRQIAAGVPPQNILPTRQGQENVAFALRTGGDGQWRILLEVVDTGREPGAAADGRLPFDGIVFVAHSAPARLDTCLSALEHLKAYLDAYGEDVTSVPLIIQYNAREENGALPLDRLESLLNPWGLLSFPASSKQGEGVKETLKSIISLAIGRILERDREGRTGRSARPAAPAAGERSPVGPPAGGERRAPAAPRPAAPGRSPASQPARQAAPSPARDQGRDPVRDPDLQIVPEEPGLFFDDVRPPIVIPVRIPRRLLDKFGSARLVLEIEVVDQDPMFG